MTSWDFLILLVYTVQLVPLLEWNQ